MYYAHANFLKYDFDLIQSGRKLIRSYVFIYIFIYIGRGPIHAQSA